MKKIISALVLSIYFSMAAASPPMGKDAIPLMTDEQVQILHTLREFNWSTNPDTLSKKFGDPVLERSNQIAWEFNHKGKVTRVYAYYLTGGMDKIHYISMDPSWGHVIYYGENGIKGETNN